MFSIKIRVEKFSSRADDDDDFDEIVNHVE